MAEYKKIVLSDPKRVRNDFGLVVRDEYIDGAMLVAFIHGTAKAQAVLTSRADTFGEAITHTLVVNLDTFFSAWGGGLAIRPPRPLSVNVRRAHTKSIPSIFHYRRTGALERATFKEPQR